jgi:hypothetical protein
MRQREAVGASGQREQRKGRADDRTHHIDVVNATARFVRLRLLNVLAGPVLPLISFRVLKVEV